MPLHPPLLAFRGREFLMAAGLGAIGQQETHHSKNRSIAVKFELPDQLPVTVAELEALAGKAQAEINVLQARHANDEELSTDDVAHLEYLLDARDQVIAERDTVAAAEQESADKLSGLLDRAAPKSDEPEAPADPEPVSEGDGDPADVVAEAEQIAADAVDQPEPVTAAAPVSFKNAAPADTPTPTPAGETPKGWEFVSSAPKFTEFAGAKVDARDIAESILSVKSGSGLNKTGVVTRGGKDFAVQPIAKLVRPSGPEIRNVADFWSELDRVTAEGLTRGGLRGAEALVAAGGWQAPSEQVYDFCAVPPAVNLVSVPELGKLPRGGVRYPIESDMAALLTDFAFQFHFTETQLEAVDGGGDPTAVKEWNELPAPTEFIEFRLAVLGYAVKVGILHAQGWPESVAHDLERLMVRHQHGISWRTINDMVAGSGSPKVVPTDTVLGATSSVLNGLALQAINLRLDKGLDTDAPIEGVAPVWFREVIRADLALRDGLDSLDVSDAQIDGFLSRRNIYLQYVDDWQTRGSGQPGNLDTLRWPDHVDVMLYPAGTWFRSLNPVISFGVQYPMELLKFNQYSHAFFEDAIVVGKRCDKSTIARVPLCVNGAVGAREEIVCTYGAAVETVTKTVTITGAPDGGNFTLKFSVNDLPTGNIAHDASAANVKTALVAIDDAYVAADFTTGGGDLPGTAVTVTYPAALGDLEVGTDGLTGGSDPEVTVS